MDNNDYKSKTKLAYQDEKIASSYKNAYENGWSRKNYRAKIIATREQEIVKFFLDKIKKDNVKKVLDIPAGTGKITKILLDNNFKTTSADISAKMLDQIDRNLLDNKNHYECVVADASELPFKNASFDLITNIRLLHRVPLEVKRKILSEAYRVSKKYLIVSFGVDSCFQKFRLFLRRIFITKLNSSPGRETKKNIKKEIENSGFKIVKVKQVIPFISNEIIYLLKK
jgi:ubiquinone/menaquinone biosynthesis C-methylase UbiE